MARKLLILASREPIPDRLLGSFVAATHLEDLTEAERLAAAGLLADPDDLLLRNNMAFILATADRVDEADRWYEGIAEADLNRPSRICWLATGGLIAFRRGNENAGRELYQKAMSLADRAGDTDRHALAAAYLAREEVRTSTPGSSDALQRAIGECEDNPAHNVKSLLAKLIRLRKVRM